MTQTSASLENSNRFTGSELQRVHRIFIKIQRNEIPSNFNDQRRTSESSEARAATMVRHRTEEMSCPRCRCRFRSLYHRHSSISMCRRRIQWEVIDLNENILVDFEVEGIRAFQPLRDDR